MAASNKKFTQRLSVRLGAVSTVVALGAIAIAHGQLTGERPSAEPSSAAAAPTQRTADLQPIPIPADEAAAPPAAPPSTWTSSQGFAALPEAPFTPPGTAASSVRLNPAGDSLIIRGNDGPETREPAPPAVARAAFDDASGALPQVPASPNFDAPRELDPGLRAAAQLAIADDRPPASGYSAAATQYELPELPAQGSVYGAPSAALAPPVADIDDTPPSTRFEAPATPAAAPVYSSDPADDDPPAQFAPPAMSNNPVAPLRDDSFPARQPDPEPQPLRFQAAPTPTASASTASASSGSGHSAGFEGDGAPGAESLDGQQTPALSVEKTAAAEIQVGKETSFQVRIRNTGPVAAHDLIVLDRVPRGTRFVNANPQATEAPDGQLMWQLGSLAPGAETTVTMQVLPISEGEIGSVAQVLFQTHASVRTICTRPELTVKHVGPAKVLIGETVLLDITISNPGSGAATGVVLEENIPEGLTHAAGRELEYEVGTLKPGESRRLQLTLKAAKPGIIENTIYVRGDGNLIAQDSIPVEVIAPSLQVSLTGPRLRYLEREATYEVGIANPGTATAREIELVTYLPKGMKFVAAEQKGQYEPQNHAVYWSLEELPPQQSGVAKLTLLPLETGEQRLSVEGRAEMGLKDASEKLVQVDGLAELQFSIVDEADPIEVGSETTYVIALNNRGSSAATDIRMTINLPPEMKPIGGDGPTKVAIEGTRVSVDPLARLGPGEQAQYKLRVRGLAAGAHRFQLQLMSGETPVPVTKEEITRVYADR
jgi:uncharacterized repeat protein (TIGR01451 family)